jgi:rare lipoprotein A
MKSLFLSSALLLILVGCASAPLRQFHAEDYAVSAATEHGIASWYGGQYNGKRTASGERYNQKDFTAAHKTLPFGTIVRVTNLQNRLSVIVEITDRGPFMPGRVIDLSQAAAMQIQLIGPGTAPVEIQVLRRL